ncbi:MAG TPA: CapA family protein [Gaiellaceae bacterium]|nr:CapA family protein [Gaiellaceae bacterium]
MPGAGAGRVTVALAGDTMLGRRVAVAIERDGPASLFAPEVVELMREADLRVLNLECCISERGEPWPDPAKPFFFRAPPPAVDALALLGVDCVTLANNHALDFGREALLDTLELLAAAGIAAVGAGAGLEQARAPAVLEAGGLRLAVLGATDHPRAYAAGPETPGVAYADLEHGLPGWLRDAVAAARGAADAVLVTPHWGPNMRSAPLPSVLAAAEGLLAAGATLVAGHSAHVFHGVRGPVLFDLGDFVDDYAADPALRNDLGLLFLVTLAGARPERLEAVPLKLDFCRTRLAEGDDAASIRNRFRSACARLGTEAAEAGGRLVVDLGSAGKGPGADPRP